MEPRVDSYRTADRDSRQLDAQLNATMHLLERWGDGVGISKGELSENHHPDLDDPHTYSVVQGLLNSIKDFSIASKQPPRIQAPREPTSPSLSGESSFPRPKISRLEKTTWALRGKLKETSRVQTLAGLVSDLYNVVSPSVADSVNPKPVSPCLGLQQQGIGPVEELYAEIRQLLRKLEKEMEAETMRDLQLWLGGPSPNDIYDDAKDKRSKETCEWILKNQDFVFWKAPSTSSKLLWIKGPAGFGKTFLCARIVQELEKTAQEHMAFFFLSSRFGSHDDPFSIIRSWLMMLITRNSAARDIVTQSRLSQPEQRATQSTILQLFHEILLRIPGCILILDGLDECAGMNSTDSKSVSRFLQELRKGVSNTTTKLLISSRGDQVIQQELSMFTGYSEYTISPIDVGPDLMTFSSELVSSKLPNKDEATKASIALRMKDRCEGQFQWIKLQEKSLRKGRSKKQLEREIDETPSGLNSLYDREWRRIESMRDSDKERAFSLLRWAAFALRPLTVNEITEAVLITEETEAMPLDEMPECIDDDYVETMILDLCGSLIQVRHDSFTLLMAFLDKAGPGSGLMEVHLSHFSVKEYLLLKSTPGSAALLSNEKLRALNENLQNTVLANSCIRYMSLPGICDNWKMEDKEKSKMKFTSYAVSNWFYHCQLAEPMDSALKDTTIAIFNGRDPNFDTFRKIMKSGTIKELPEAQEDPVSLFKLAVLFGFKHAVAFLIQEGKGDVEDRSFDDSTPLLVASSLERHDIVKVLLDNGADPNAQSRNNQTALVASIKADNNDITELLLERGADVSMLDRYGRSPLYLASRRGNLKAAQQLLDKGADVSALTQDGFTPLRTACRHNHLEVLKLLLERGADASMTDNNGMTPLYLASGRGNLQAAQQLLDKGANASAPNREGSTPLMIASKYGHLELVKLLIGRGADVDMRTEAGYGALHVSLRRGHFQVAQLLFDHGASIEIGDNTGRTSLHSACKYGNLPMVELLLGLLQTTCDAIDDPDKWGSTPLSFAARFGHANIVRALLDTGSVDVWASDNFGRTTIWWATNQGHDQVVSLLTGTNLGDEELVSSSGERKGRYCDICLLTISRGYFYHCGICNEDDFDICRQCAGLGGHCFNEAHELIRLEKEADT
ncbi:hypothetical protein F53441_2660 [Fusarium austroafricanum]|uniref:NACHT domain-containing protein n=1 Tax=Fusarium austroafricanum TaxID=2364996 RepID=A0A8H4P3P9_9HYPO|nr:hypothetical protein F53441_2660 [Fusarium austroafricanum]